MTDPRILFASGGAMRRDRALELKSKERSSDGGGSA
jgi:hypothetical protein